MSRSKVFRFKSSAAAAIVIGLFAGLMLAGCILEDDDDSEKIDHNYTYTGRTVQIADLTWMAENLNRVTRDSWCYDNNASNCVKYGRMYTWHAAQTACPAGWRLPTAEDWIGMLQLAGTGTWEATTKLKSTSGWENIRGNDCNGSDDFGFSALPGGYRMTNGIFYQLGYRASWWTATERDAHNASYMNLAGDGAYVYNYGDGKTAGLSVRCIQD